MVYNTMHMIQVIQIKEKGGGIKKEETQWMETGHKSSIF